MLKIMLLRMMQISFMSISINIKKIIDGSCQNILKSKDRTIEHLNRRNVGNSTYNNYNRREI